MNETIDDKVEFAQAINQEPRCLFNNILQYRSKAGDGKQFCCLSEEKCIYYKTTEKKESLCMNYDKKR